MARQLDILALEPYFGGVRRNMLETLTRCSKHRWTLLTLPPRRMERRLAASAHWFAERLSRKQLGPTDLLFTSDALNLADLQRLYPAIAGHPSVVYFHCNQLPDAGHHHPENNVDLTNLNSAMAASQVWFNTLHHSLTFSDSLQRVIETHPELQSHSPLAEITGKLRVISPPVDLNQAQEIQSAAPVERDPNAVFIDLRDANIELLNAALRLLHGQKMPVRLITTGQADLVDLFPRQSVPEHDLPGQIRGLLAATVYVSAHVAAPFDEHAVRAMFIGCRPVLPHSGIYPELVPASLQSTCMYDMTAESLAAHIREAIFLLPHYNTAELTVRLHGYDSIPACKRIDDHLENIANTAAAATAAKPSAPRRRNHVPDAAVRTVRR